MPGTTAMFPNALGITVMGHTLWNKNLLYEDIVNDYFENSYGEGWEKVRHYLEQLSRMYYYVNLEDKNLAVSSEKSQVCHNIIEFINDFKHEIDIFRKEKTDCQKLMWDYLNIHSDIWLDMTNILKYIYDGKKEVAMTMWKNISLKLWENENMYQKVFDIYNFTRAFDDIFLKAYE